MSTLEIVVALLRGINLAGRNKVAMADLRDQLAKKGIVMQALQVVFNTDRCGPRLAPCDRSLQQIQRVLLVPHKQ